MTQMEVGQEALRAGFSVRYFDAIGSTNAHALSIADEPGASGVWIVAGRQTEGRGRLGRTWSSPPGNFYGSLSLREPCEARHAAKLGFVAGVALVDAVRSLAPRLAGLALKWPNDLLLGGAKVAGILLEATQRPGNHLSIVIGMGVNLAFHPDGTPYPTTDLASHGCPISPQTLFGALSDAFARHLARFDQGRGFEVIRSDWLAAAQGLGGPITVRLAQATIDGVFGSIDADGRLILIHDDTPHIIDAGDVYFPTLSALGASEHFRIER